MTPLAVIFVLSSAFLHALTDFFTKKSNDKQVFVWCYLVFSLLIYSPLFFYYLILKITDYSFLFSYTTGLILVLSGIIHFVYIIFKTKSYETGDLSHVYPIMRSSPALVLVVSILFLHEKVSIIGGMGIGLVAAGVYLINLKKISFHTLTEPVVSIFSERAAYYAFLTLLCVTAYSLIDKLAVDRIHPFVFLYIMVGMCGLLLTTYLFIHQKMGLVMVELQKNKVPIAISGVFGFFSYLLILSAFAFSPLSYVVGLRQVSILFAIFLGGRLLQEKNKQFRLVCGFIIFLGAFLISIA